MQVIEVKIESPTGAVLYNRKHTGPSTWKELTRAHLLCWAAAMKMSIPLADAKGILAFFFFEIPRHLSRPLKRSGCMQLGAAVNWLFKRNKLDTWLIPSIWSGIFKYYGPKSRLGNITVQEYMLSELCYEQFDLTKDTGYLDTLAAILFRPQRFFKIDTDIRKRLTTDGRGGYVKRAKRFKKLPDKLKFAIYLNYEGCRHFIIDHNKDVFVTRSNAGGKITRHITKWHDIVESAAGGKFGTMKETKDANLPEFLSELGARIRERRELEKTYNK